MEPKYETCFFQKYENALDLEIFNTATDKFEEYSTGELFSD